METNIALQAWQRLKQAIDYTPPLDPEPFVLDENRPADSGDTTCKLETPVENAAEQHAAMLRYAKRLAIYLEKVQATLKAGFNDTTETDYKAELEALLKQWRDLAPLTYSYQKNQPTKVMPISTSLEETRRTLEKLYLFPTNRDLIIREISIAGNPPAAAIVVYLDGLVDGQKISEFLLAPLMNPNRPHRLYENNTIAPVMREMIPNSQVRSANSFDSLQEGINTGDTALIIDGFDEVVIIGTKGWEHRGVTTPHTEQTIRGSLAAFSENLRVNTGLIRSILHSSDLITEMVKIGRRGQLTCALMYISSIANAGLVKEVKRRLNGIDTDYIIDSGQLVQFIDDNPSLIFPQTLSTERPDRAAASLAEGRLALILEGNPFVQILPVSFFTFFHSAEDFSVKSGIGNFMRSLRLFGTIISTILPSLYLSLSYFHSEAMPTELILAVAASRESVPFPAWFEVFMMEISFELIREAGVRIPGILGSTIGIVGAIILGQAAVTAKLVSPIVVVIIAITGLSSFTIPEYRMGSAIRIIRFMLLIISTTMGLVGLSLGFLFLIALLCHAKSYGMPYMVPFGPKTVFSQDVIQRGQVFNQEFRPDSLQTKDRRRQPDISRLWRKKPPEGGKK